MTSGSENALCLVDDQGKGTRYNLAEKPLNEDTRGHLAIIVVFGTDVITEELVNQLDSLFIPYEEAISRLKAWSSDPEAVLLDLADNGWLDTVGIGGCHG